MARKTDGKNAVSEAQRASFVEAARALECDESEERFDETLKKVARHKPPPDNQDGQEKKDEDQPPS